VYKTRELRASKLKPFSLSRRINVGLVLNSLLIARSIVRKAVAKVSIYLSLIGITKLNLVKIQYL
jgi:hypothetical protein